MPAVIRMDSLFYAERGGNPMKKFALSRVLIILGLCFVSLLLSGAQKKETPQPSPDIPEKLLDGLKWRCIGPAHMGGRIDDFAVGASSPAIIYAGSASGGLWETANNGGTWEPLFDGGGTSSLGRGA